MVWPVTRYTRTRSTRPTFRGSLMKRQRSQRMSSRIFSRPHQSLFRTRIGVSRMPWRNTLARSALSRQNARIRALANLSMRSAALQSQARIQSLAVPPSSLMQGLSVQPSLVPLPSGQTIDKANASGIVSLPSGPQSSMSHSSSSTILPPLQSEMEQPSSSTIVIDT